ncbi:MAG: glycosyltransferase family 4 protein, partial [Calditrichaeota bacterium]
NDPARKVLERPWEMLRRKLYRYATLVTANSHGSLQALAAYVDPHKLAFVPNPLTPYRNHRNNYHDPLFKFPFILTVGRLHPQKAHDVLLKAFSYLPEHLKEWRLAFLGKGELKPTLQNEAQRLGIADRVEWYGQVQDPFPFYKAAKIFTLASRYEGMSNALMEAMSCGLPVIVSDACPGSLELVEHEKTGLVVPVDDPRALAEAITRLAEDPALRKRLGKAAQQRVADFEVSKALAAWEQTIGLKAPDE